MPEDQPADSEVDAALRDLHAIVRYQSGRVAELQAALDAVREELEASRRALESSRLVAGAQERELQAQTAQLDDVLRSLGEIHRTKLFRWSIVPRRLYGRFLRALRSPDGA